MEINPRLGGGPVYIFQARVWGVCMVEEHLIASVGMPCRRHC